MERTHRTNVYQKSYMNERQEEMTFWKTKKKMKRTNYFEAEQSKYGLNIVDVNDIRKR